MTTGMSRGGPQTFAEHDTRSDTGWGVFGGVTLILLGTVNLIHGITALQYDELLATELVYDDLTFWGWAFVIWAALQIGSGIATLMGTRWGPSLGLSLATLGAVGWFFMIFAAPVSAVIGMLLSIMVIASLASALAE